MVPELLEGELREGNFIFYSGQIVQLNEKNIDLVYLRNSGSVEGVDLNVTWLENFGFFYVTSTEELYTFYLNGVKIELSDDFAMVNIHNTDAKKIRYVHELQNLFFALTGNELILKEVS